MSSRDATLRRRAAVSVVVAAVFGVGAVVLALVTFSGRLGFARPLLGVLFVLPLVALGAVVVAVVSAVQAGKAGS